MCTLVPFFEIWNIYVSYGVNEKYVKTKKGKLPCGTGHPPEAWDTSL